MPWLFHSKVGSTSEGNGASPKPFFPLRSSITGYHYRESINSTSAAPPPSSSTSSRYQSTTARQQQNHENQNEKNQQQPLTGSSSPMPPNYLVPRASLTLPLHIQLNSTTGSPSLTADSVAGVGMRKKDILAIKNEVGPKLILVMVGLPARGKSYICKKLCRYLSWCGFNTKVFNVGNRRRVFTTNDDSLKPGDHDHHDQSDRPAATPSPTPRNPYEAPALSLPASLVPSAANPQHLLLSPAESPAMSGSFISSSPISSADGVDITEGVVAPVPRKMPGLETLMEEGGGRKKEECPSFLTVVTDSNGAVKAGDVTHSPVVISAAGTTHDANFFDPKNENAKAIRERLAMDTLDEAIDWLKYGGGKVAIHDATNSTVERRRAIIDRVAKEKNMQAVFVESICTDEKLLESNILMKLKGPDYINMPREEAIRDFKARMHNYEKAYETISEEEEALEDVSYIKLINVGKKVIANNIHGYIASQCVFYLMQIHIKKRVIWLTRHGESMYNAYNRIGGDPPLTELGHRYASALARFIQKFHPPPPPVDSASSSMFSNLNLSDNQQQTHRRRRFTYADDFGGGGGTGIPTSNRHIATESDSDVSPDHPNPDTVATNGPNTIPPRPLAIWTSTLERTVQSVEGLSPDDYEIKHMRNLNEISAGQCENLTYDEIESQYPQVWAERQANKLLFRYPGPGGESYSDVIERLRPVIVELERMESDTLIVSHQVVMRTLLAYFCGLPLEEMTHLGVPLHTLYRLQPTPYGADLIKYEWNPITDEFDVVGTTL